MREERGGERERGGAMREEEGNERGERGEGQ